MADYTAIICGVPVTNDRNRRIVAHPAKSGLGTILAVEETVKLRHFWTFTGWPPFPGRLSETPVPSLPFWPRQSGVDRRRELRESIGREAQMEKRTNQPARIALYRGRWWAAAMLLLLAPLCFVIGLIPLMLPDAWLAMLLIGLPSLFCAWLCAVNGCGEAIARVEIREDGFSLRLPRYRGYLPRPPAQRLAAAWPADSG